LSTIGIAIPFACELRQSRNEKSFKESANRTKLKKTQNFREPHFSTELASATQYKLWAECI